MKNFEKFVNESNDSSLVDFIDKFVNDQTDAKVFSQYGEKVINVHGINTNNNPQLIDKLKQEWEEIANELIEELENQGFKYTLSELTHEGFVLTLSPKRLMKKSLSDYQ